MLDKLYKVKEYNKYFIGLYKSSQKDIIIMSLKILIPVLLITIAVKYIAKRKYDIRYTVIAIWAYYASSLLHVTIFSRGHREDVWGKLYLGWGNLCQEEAYEAIENLVMLFPITFLLLLGVGRIYFKKTNFLRVVTLAFVFSLCFSLGIEFSQVRLGKGTFQYADIVYNTIGGLFGGIIYWISASIRRLLDKLLD